MTRLVLCGLLLALPRVAPAAPGDAAPEAGPLLPKTAPSRDIVIDVPGERSLNNKLIIGGVFATGLIASAFGLYWHLDSRDASDAVSADEFTGEAWTPEHAALVERADQSKTRATVAYAVGGAFLIGAVAAYLVTEPEHHTSVIRTGVLVTPAGDAMVTRMWSF